MQVNRAKGGLWSISVIVTSTISGYDSHLRILGHLYSKHYGNATFLVGASVLATKGFWVRKIALWPEITEAETKTYTEKSKGHSEPRRVIKGSHSSWKNINKKTVFLWKVHLRERYKAWLFSSWILLILWTWANHQTPMKLSFPMCEMEVLFALPAYLGCCEG